MRRNVLLAIAASVLLVGFATLLPAQGPPPAMQSQWEYRVFLITEIVNLQQKPGEMSAALEAKFNELGKDGWDIAENINGGSSSRGRSVERGGKAPPDGHWIRPAARMSKVHGGGHARGLLYYRPTRNATVVGLRSIPRRAIRSGTLGKSVSMSTVARTPEGSRASA